MSTRFYYGQQDYIVQLNLLDDIANGSASTAAFNAFDARYLGNKTTDPTLNNSGQPLIQGAMYWNTTTGTLKVYSGTGWAQVGGATAASIGLGNVNNTSDLAKPVSTAQQTALDAKLGLTATAAAATKLATPRLINGVAFDGTADITISASGTTISWTNVTGTPVTLAGYGVTAVSWSILTGKPTTLAGYGITDALPLTATASAATKLATARLINGVPFDGTADITVTAGAGTFEPIITAGTTAQYWRGDKTWQSLALAVSTLAAATAGSATTAGSASAVPWTGVTGKPTTVAGYGITDAMVVGSNAASATKLVTARLINGVSFDGTADITLPTGSATSVPWTGVTGKPTTMAGFGIADFVSSNSGNSVLKDNATTNGHYYITDSTMLGQTDGGLYVQAFSTSWVGQIYQDYRTGQIALRGKNNNVWGSWRTVLDSVNFNGYAPTLAGVGATGSWPISVTGSAASATTATTATKANTLNATGNTLTFNWSGQGGQPTWLWGGTTPDNMYVYNPSNFNVATAVSATTAGSAAKLTGPAYTNGTDGWFRSSGTTGWFNADYGVGIYAAEAGAVRTYNNARWISCQGTAALPAYSFTNDQDTGLYSEGDGYLNFSVNAGYRGRFDASGNFGITGNFYGGSAGLTGFAASMTAGAADLLNATCVSRNYNWTGIQYFTSNKGYQTYLAGQTGYALEAFSADEGSAAMSFHRGGKFAVNFGLDPDNVMRFGGWSAAANIFQMDMAGNLTMAGNVAAYSDVRLKTNWRTPEIGFVARWAKVQAGTYDRIDSGETQVGLSAQDVKEILPHATPMQNDGYLGLNYGGAAAVATVEIAKELEALKAVVKHQGALIKLLMEKAGY